MPVIVAWLLKTDLLRSHTIRAPNTELLDQILDRSLANLEDWESPVGCLRMLC